MRNIIYILSVLIFISCTGPQGIIISDEDKAKFEKNYKSFEKHHVGGIVSEDLDLYLDLFADSLKWSPPNYTGEGYLTKSDLAEVAGLYIEKFENFSFVPGGVSPDDGSAYWGGSLYSDKGDQTTEPNGIRIYGMWNATHSETGESFKIKFYAIQQFNEAGKVHLLNEWFDTSQIQDFLESGE